QDRRARPARRGLRGHLHRTPPDARADRGHRDPGGRGRHRAQRALGRPQLSLRAGARAPAREGRGGHRGVRGRHHPRRRHRVAQDPRGEGALHPRHLHPGHRALRAREHPRGGVARFRMDFTLTDDQQAVRTLAREFAEAEVAPVIREYDEKHEFPHAVIARLAETGLLGALVPEEYGGAALDYVSYALAVEELNRVDGSVGITMWAHNSLCSNHIALFGSPAQKAAYLPGLARGEMLGAWALTEPGSGSDAAPMKTRAVRDGDHFVLDGTKAFITNAGVGKVAVVMAVTDAARGTKGISAFIVDKGRPGFSASPPSRKLG